jgi:hypothetical protein
VPRASPRAAWSRLLPTLLLAIGVGAALAFVRVESRSTPSTSRPLAATSAAPTRSAALATEFARIALAFAQHRPDEVDAYFGPASLRPAAGAAPIPLGVLAQRAHHLVDQLDAEPRRANQPPRRLLAEARALATVIDGPHQSFDDEAREIYGMSVAAADADANAEAEADGASAARIDAALAVLDRLLPHAQLPSPADSLAARFGEYRKHFAIPADRRRAVFAAALAGCRARTAAHWTLPAGEHLDVKWDIGAPGAWHRYEGDGRSTLTINPAAVAFIDTAVDLACHEGYPGHHAQFLLADRIGQPAREVPLEDTVALLRSPIAMLREGAANYAVDLAFPPEDRLRFERDTLFPLAGLDADSMTTAAGAATVTTEAARYFAIRQLVRALEPAIIPILRAYRDGRLSEAEAADRLERRALVTSPQALLRFVDNLGPYVLGYTTARDRLAAYVARQTQTQTQGQAEPHAQPQSQTPWPIHAQPRSDAADAWAVLRTLLMSPDATVLNVAPATRAPTSTAAPAPAPVSTRASTPTRVQASAATRAPVTSSTN